MLLSPMVVPDGMEWTLFLSVVVVLLTAVPILLVTYHFETLERADLVLGRTTGGIALLGVGRVVTPMVQRFAPAVVPVAVTVVDRLLEATTAALHRGSGSNVAVLIVEVSRPTAAGARLGLSTVELSALVMRRLRTQLPREYSIARLTPHRFAVLAEGLPRGGANVQAEQVAQLLNRPWQGDGRTTTMTFTIGAAEAASQLNTAIRLVRAAQRAHAAAVVEALDTNNERTVWRIYEAQIGSVPAEVDVRALGRIITSGVLKAGFRPMRASAAEPGTISALHVQPLWTNDRGVAIEPTVLSAAARSLHLATAASRLSVDDCLRVAAAWNDSALNPARLLVEVEPELLRDPDFPASLLGNMNRRAIPAAGVCVTTDARLATLDADLLRPALTQLRAQGVEVLLNRWSPQLTAPAQGADEGRQPRPPAALPISGVILAPSLASMMQTEPSQLRRIISAVHDSGLSCHLDGLNTPDDCDAAASLGADLLAGPAIGSAVTATEMTRRFKSSRTTIYS